MRRLYDFLRAGIVYEFLRDFYKAFSYLSLLIVSSYFCIFLSSNYFSFTIIWCDFSIVCSNLFFYFAKSFICFYKLLRCYFYSISLLSYKFKDGDALLSVGS